MLHILAVLTAGILWGTMGIFVRYLTELGFTRMQLVGFRSVITLVVVGIIILLRNRKDFKIKLRDLWVFFGSGVIAILFFTYCYFTTINLTSLSTACVLLYTSPIFVMLISLAVFKERLTLPKIIALLLAFGGCVLVSGIGGSLTTVGLLIGLGSGLGYGLYSIFTRLGTLKGYSPLTVTFYTFAFATFGCLFLCDVPDMAAKAAAQPSVIPVLLALGIVTSVMPYLLYSWGLTGLEASRASIIASIEPVAATVLGIAIYHESLTLAGGLGILMVLGAILVLSVKKKSQNIEKED